MAHRKTTCLEDVFVQFAEDAWVVVEIPLTQHRRMRIRKFRGKGKGSDCLLNHLLRHCSMRSTVFTRLRLLQVDRQMMTRKTIVVAMMIMIIIVFKALYKL